MKQVPGNNNVSIIIPWYLTAIIAVGIFIILSFDRHCAILYFMFFDYERGYAMAVNYNRLRKLLIDKGITKTKMRKRAGISTTVLAKMAKMKLYR